MKYNQINNISDIMSIRQGIFTKYFNSFLIVGKIKKVPELEFDKSCKTIFWR